ncbi:DNA mismatch repair protein MutS [filamentous cyanobacterium LEGE 11480]|uniref:DNA mismatch repair protein MutS n=1 Tax=Romeriopsis navalis LEGE 11480 TaxID=2777977 RepID=A0A928VK86_9CYAN|nr:DNA mismatch repair protein MutS [Romeriopsis navalis]MBE9029273.1 DNA mismatch repair protein MutS [Romeriopsis navalis LEGE 11480]
MAQSPKSPDSNSLDNSTADLPERLVKHEVKYADHRSVEREDLTPMLRHYADTKDAYANALLLYRVGDFFETFFQDAVTVARELELVLTSKEGGKAVGRVPLAGIPHHALDRYCASLVEKGYAVAVCDQVEDPALAEGKLVRREVTRVITPGTLLEEGMLNARKNNYLAAVVITQTHWGLAFADISTGEFLTTQSTGLDQLNQELTRLHPAEILFPVNAPDLGGLLRPGQTSDQLPDGLPTQFCYTLRPQSGFVQAEARSRLMNRFKLRSLEGVGCEQRPLATRAAGGLLEYLESTSERQFELGQGLLGQDVTQVPLQMLTSYTLTEFLTLDNSTRRNLEITQTQRDGVFYGSLLWALDRTITPMGSRALRRWLQQPLLDRQGIEARQQTIGELVDDFVLREDIQKRLRQIYDLERLAGRAGSGTATPRDLVALADSMEQLPELAYLVQSAQSPYLQALQNVPPIMRQLAEKLRNYLVDKPPLSLTEGGLIRVGIDDELDRRRQQVEADQQWIAQLEVTERLRTGISTLKVGYNKAFGYYISISRTKSDQAPEDYIRKQTLTNEERYITPDLKECENRLLTAQQELGRLEYDLFVGLRSEVGAEADTIRQVARAVAAADVLAGLAEIAIYQDYSRPEITDGREVEIIDGRHPVVEQSLPAGFFVPNSTTLGPLKTHSGKRAPDLVVLTGPNASGKSCYLRQVGLIQLMAQVGSFIPATSAKLGVCDRIFTRVGAVDDLATGQSTFMVEMNETANILNHATDRSLVLLDEIGRGTATFDGLSIAWSVSEYLATEIRSRTIFATHYHELNELASLLMNVANYQVTVKEMPEQIIFLHKVQPGGADRSYGIEAGRLAGLPPQVIKRAKQVMGQIEKHSKIAIGLRRGPQTSTTKASPVADHDAQLGFFEDF